jgi:outer membrane protein TolC
LAEATSSLDAAHLRADLADAFHRTRAGASRARTIGRSALPAMEEARAMTEESYRAGRADLVRVLEAERAVLDLRLAEREAIAAWSRSFADLERAVGASLRAPGADAAR